MCYPRYGDDQLWTSTNRFYYNYYALAKRYEKMYPNFKIFKSETISTVKGQKDLYNFLEIPEESRHYEKGIRENRSLT